MRDWLGRWLAIVLAVPVVHASAQSVQTVVDIPTRPGITQRLVVLTPPVAKAAVVMFAGGHGGLQVFPNGSLKWGDGNFLVRTRQLFAAQGLEVVLIDAPSDRQSAPFLSGFRQTPEHAADVKVVIAWLRNKSNVPVWLVGTSRGTQSVAYIATELSGSDGPDGIVLTSSILADRKSRSVPDMPLEKIRIPVLIVHHEQDNCRVTPYAEAPSLLAKLTNSPRKQLLSIKGGESTGDPCEAFAYHGYNGIEQDVVVQIADWILAR